MALTKEEKQEIFDEFGQHEGDTGSSQVQIALLTKRITQLTEHMKRNHQDYATQRGLLRMVGKRRKLLAYLRDNEPEEYQQIILRLGLRR